jgi:serine/threonine-protein kinase HipA
MPNKLNMFLNRRHIGEIILDGTNDLYGLAYSPDWLSEGGYPVSPHLKFESSPNDAVKRFLANLLPEGKWLDELSVYTRVSKANIFGLIAAIGKETTGALTFEMDGQSPATSETSFREIPQAELTQRIRERQEKSITIWDGKPRLSVTGMQDKLPILIMGDGRMGFGEGDLASTHILKFGTSPQMHLVVNEFICMKLAGMVGLPTAEVELTRMGEPVLVVKRFDRLREGTDLVNRLHLIDGCQMLDLPSTYKYERPFGKGGNAAGIRTGANLPALFAASGNCRAPAVAMRDLLNWLLFQLLIANSDAHAKNISFFVGPAGIDVAPAYDLVCLDIYGDRYERDLAMAIGDTFGTDDINAFQLAEMCEDCKLPQRQVAKTFITLCQRMLLKLAEVALPADLTAEERGFASTMTAMIKERTLVYLDHAEKLAKVVL